MLIRRMLLGGAAAITVGSGLAGPGLAQAAVTPRTPGAAAQVAQPRDVEFGPSLRIHKTHEDPVDGTVTYTLWVSNEGNLPTRGHYTVVDSLPDGLTAVSAGGRHWYCSTDEGRRVTCRSDDRLDPRESSEPITLRTRITDRDACLLVNVAAVTGGSFFDRDVHVTKDVLRLPCHRDDHDPTSVHVDVDVEGNNNGGDGGDSSGATSNGNGHVHGVAGGFAGAKSDGKSDTDSKSGSGAGAFAHIGGHGRR